MFERIFAEVFRQTFLRTPEMGKGKRQIVKTVVANSTERSNHISISYDAVEEIVNFKRTTPERVVTNGDTILQCWTTSVPRYVKFPEQSGPASWDVKDKEK